MSNKLHGRATTTPLIRKSIQESNDTILVLAARYGINFKTVLKWKHRTDVNDQRPGPEARSTVLSREEAAVVLFRKNTLLPLDDCLYALKKTISQLTRYSLHRCFQRHGIGKLPHLNQPKKKTKLFKKYEPGYIHLDITQVHTKEGKRSLFVAIDRTTKFCVVRLYENQTAAIAVEFLQEVIKELPNKINKLLTDNGLQFTHHSLKDKNKHIFTRSCQSFGIEHRLTQPFHPWTNGQVERMNRTIKEATVKKYFYKDFTTLNRHLKTLLDV